MSEPSQARAVEKRQRFVEAAARLIHRQGLSGTTLSDIAAEAQMPSGSLYYYFKSKHEIVAAIVAERLRELEQKVARWEQAAAPRARLQALVAAWADDRDNDARYGCPIGSLCYELAKSDRPGENPAAAPLRALAQWSAAQLGALGYAPDRAAELALHLLASLQGISLIANAFQEPQVILRETDQLQRWLQEL